MNITGRSQSVILRESVRLLLFKGYCFDYYSFVGGFEIGKQESFNIVLLLNDDLGFPESITSPCDLQ